jgi:hypothetical protein
VVANEKKSNFCPERAVDGLNGRFFSGLGTFLGALPRTFFSG